MGNIDYASYDKKMRKYRSEKIAFAKKNGFDHFTELLHVKKKEGMGSGSISEWINFEVDDFEIKPGAIENFLRKFGGMKQIYVQRKNNQVEELKNVKIPLDKKYTKNICDCCKIRHVAPGNRLLCNQCHKGGSATDRHGIVNFTG